MKCKQRITQTSSLTLKIAEIKLKVYVGYMLLLLNICFFTNTPKFQYTQRIANMRLHPTSWDYCDEMIFSPKTQSTSSLKWFKPFEIWECYENIWTWCLWVNFVLSQWTWTLLINSTQWRNYSAPMRAKQKKLFSIAARKIVLQH